MIAVGLDIGGTKIETQCFNADWAVTQSDRVQTPTDYSQLVSVIAEQIRKATRAHPDVPVGLGCAGLLNPATGLAFTANLPASGHELLNDVNRLVPQHAVWINDCRALTLSEAVFGAGRGANMVAGIILGTGVGGGIALGGRLLPEWSGTGGEFGHISASASLIADHNLPIHSCGCGKRGCVETYIAGPGLMRLVKTVTGQDLTPAEIGSARLTDTDVGQAWQLWCALVADLIVTVTYNADPDVVVLGGGLSKIGLVTEDIENAVTRAQFTGYRVPQIRIAEGGDASGARGAAYNAWTIQAKSGGSE